MTPDPPSLASSASRLRGSGALRLQFCRFAASGYLHYLAFNFVLKIIIFSVFLFFLIEILKIKWPKSGEFSCFG